MSHNDTPTPFRREPATTHLPSDGAKAEAAVAAWVRGDAAFLPREALEQQRQRIEALRDPLAPNSLDELARQLPTLEALWQRFAVEAAREGGSPDHRVKYLKAALHAQQAFARTFALLRTLRHQQLGARATVTLDHGPD